MSAKKITILALFTAINCLITCVLPIPTGLGNLNFADATAFLAVALFGIYGAAVGSVGGFLADLLTGYAAFAPFTLIVKALMGCTAHLLLSLWKKRKTKKPLGAFAYATCFLGGGTVMVLGYFCTNWILTGSAVAALTGGVPFDLAQAVIATALGTLLTLLCTKNQKLFRFFQ